MDRVEEAMKKVGRGNFVPLRYKWLAGADQALPIGYGQTISQPTTVRLMLEWLDVQPGQKVLDVGSGSGWTAALAGYLVGDQGRVDAVEIIDDLVDIGQRNARRAGIRNIKFFHAGDDYGLPERAPYDRILVSASADHVPETLKRQLKPGGKMVIPVQTEVLEMTKLGEQNWRTITHPGFIFVPLI